MPAFVFDIQSEIGAACIGIPKRGAFTQQIWQEEEPI